MPRTGHAALQFGINNLKTQPAGLRDFFLPNTKITDRKKFAIDMVDNKIVSAKHTNGGQAIPVAIDNKKSEIFSVPEAALIEQVTDFNNDKTILTHEFDSADKVAMESLHYTQMLKAINILHDTMTIEALKNGQVTDSNGNIIYDYSRDSDIDTTATFGGASDDPIAIIDAASRTLIHKGTSPNRTGILLGRQAFNLLSDNSKFKDLLDNRTLASSNKTVGTTTNGVSHVYNLFMAQKFYDFYTYNYTKDHAGTPIVPDDTVIIFSMDNLGWQVYGGITVSINGVDNVLTGNIVADRFSQKNPDGTFRRLQSRFFPLFPNINNFAHISVS